MTAVHLLLVLQSLLPAFFPPLYSGAVVSLSVCNQVTFHQLFQMHIVHYVIILLQNVWQQKA